MKQFVPSEQLWSADWNGDMDFEYDHSVYWPALNEMCRMKRERRMARWIAAGCHIGESEDYLAGGTDVSVSGFVLSSDPVPVAVPAEGDDDAAEVEIVQEKLAEATLEDDKPAEAKAA
ncbi:hypothetical protein E4U43_006023 [Claviceps pusilla]|uniref:Uncharacterized protein n=1 Tax=Claviceps pusilla TaxID=123648 RepID=A0A9P7ST07_9HYPO|nr:hypothetical protein E4U43_006023 [Claviceps pusilla]